MPPRPWIVSPLPSPPASYESAKGLRPQPVIYAVSRRVGAPAPPPPATLSIINAKRSECLPTSFDNNFISKAGKVAKKHDVDYDDVDFVPLVRGIRPLEPTVLIVAKWTKESTTAWKEIVAEVKQHVDRELLRSNLQIYVRVEIIDPQLLQPKVLGPVLGSPRLEHDWPEIQKTVFDMLESSVPTRGGASTPCLLSA